MKTSKEYRAIARESLKNNWALAVVIMLLISVIESALAASMIGSVLTLIISGPLAVGVILFFTKLIEKQNVGFETIIENISQDFSNKVTTYLLQVLYTFLWSLLLIVPGIIKSYSYALTMYIKSKNTDISNNDAITLSRKLMNGKKAKLFCLHLSFIGWFILCILTFGIGFIFLAQYYETANVAFYIDAYKEDNMEVVGNQETENIEDDSSKEIVIEE